MYSLLAVIICAAGFLIVKQETRSNYLWVVTSQQTWDDFQEHTETFGSRRVEALLAVSKEPGIVNDNETTHFCAGGDTLTKEILLELLDAHEKVLSLKVEVDGRTYSYNDLCLRLLQGGKHRIKLFGNISRTLQFQCSTRVVAIQ